MKVAIYSRKSVFTGKGESIENQIQMCKDHYLRNYPNNDCEFEVYEDEGYTGANIKRPQFQKLISEIKKNKYEALICYRLDRISRNVADFSSILELLQTHNVSFISIKEQFDTSTPIGKAMVYIASVFAQLERDTIAERVRDNMLQLAKTGRWLGGQTPLGFESERIIYIDEEMKERLLYMLKPIPEEIELIKKIYNKYMVTGSKLYVTKYLTTNNYKGKRGGDFHNISVADILRNPVYVKSDNRVKDYLESKGIQFCGKPNVCGIMLYNKRFGKSQHNPMDKWIGAISKHEGIIDAEDWLTVQHALDSTSESYNKKKIRLGTSKRALLTSVLKCAKSGSPMRITYGSIKKDGQRSYYYSCNTKCTFGKAKCDNPNANAAILEREIIKTLIHYDKNVLKKKLADLLKNEHQFNSSDNYNNLNLEISSLEDEINNLMNQLSKTKNKTTQDFLIKKADELSTRLDELKDHMNSKNISKNNIQKDIDNLSIVIESFDDFNKLCSSITDLASLDNESRVALKNLISRLVDKITYDGETHNIEIDIWGKKKITNDNSSFLGGLLSEKSQYSMSSKGYLSCKNWIIISNIGSLITKSML